MDTLCLSSSWHSCLLTSSWGDHNDNVTIVIPGHNPHVSSSTRSYTPWPRPLCQRGSRSSTRNNRQFCKSASLNYSARVSKQGWIVSLIFLILAYNLPLPSVSASQPWMREQLRGETARIEVSFAFCWRCFTDNNEPNATQTRTRFFVYVSECQNVRIRMKLSLWVSFTICSSSCAHLTHHHSQPSPHPPLPRPTRPLCSDKW